MVESAIKEIIAKAKELWAELHFKPYETYGADDDYGLPIIYLDTAGDIDWCEKGFEEFWVDAQVVFKFPCTVAESVIEHTIRQEITKYEKEQKV